MDKNVKLLSDALRLAERAHAQYELKGGKDQWPDFYAQWLFDNLQLWTATYGCADGSCATHTEHNHG